MTSVLSDWLSDKALFFRYISAIPPGWSGGFLTPLQYTLLSSLNNNLRALPSMHNQSFSLKPFLLFQHCLPLITPPPLHTHTHTCTYPACVSSLSQHIPTRLASQLSSNIYLHSLHLSYPPTYTYTACTSIISQHIRTLPVSHLSPKYTYTACVSFILIPTCHLSSDSKAKSSSQYQIEFFTRHLRSLICANFLRLLRFSIYCTANG